MKVSDGQKSHFLSFVLLKCSIISSTDRKHVAMEVLWQLRVKDGEVET